MVSFTEYQAKVHSTKQQRINNDLLYALNRSISVRLSYFLVYLFPKVKPNHVSVFLIITSLFVLISNILYGVAPAFYLVLIQLFFLQLAVIGDRVDGEIARFQSHFTQAGIYYDRVFHFIFPFSLYVSTGYFFAYLNNTDWPVTLAFLLAVLASLSGLVGKLRHHIKYKIILENHSQLIKDLRYQSSPTKPSSFFSRLSHYLIFMMYDWVWGLYLTLVILAMFWPKEIGVLFIVYTAICVAVFLFYLIWTVPRYHLFSKQDFGVED